MQVMCRVVSAMPSSVKIFEFHSTMARPVTFSNALGRYTQLSVAHFGPLSSCGRWVSAVIYRRSHRGTKPTLAETGGCRPPGALQLG